MAYADTDRLKVRGWAENMWDEQGWESLANSAIALCDDHERLRAERDALRARLAIHEKIRALLLEGEMTPGDRLSHVLCVISDDATRLTESRKPGDHTRGMERQAIVEELHEWLEDLDELDAAERVA